MRKQSDSTFTRQESTYMIHLTKNKHENSNMYNKDYKSDREKSLSFIESLEYSLHINKSHIKYKHMFGCYVVRYRKRAFAIFFQGSLFIKPINESVLSKLKKMRLKTWDNVVEQQFNTNVNFSSYYCLCDNFTFLNCQHLKIIREILLSFDNTLEAREINGFVNIDTRLYQKLKAEGISSIAILKKTGAIETYLKLYLRNRNISKKVLWKLEGAIRGCHYELITLKDRENLIIKFETLLLAHYHRKINFDSNIRDEF
ncbi:hypothetical protein ACOMICROBIO_GDFFDHBD_03004 [Vibrio sp. B1REV9]|uniref:TfoX/Sxy family DNA transformation protein n=1 Tax=Vibrio sp. B1REV9 TaxID=2751179 RepID=UPI001AF295F5|nr:TfoX/Sxy family DNA transformation protein [Vibrio sp. B1REV9]CAE6937742.1 hypothetical protein ACOMICROBIO_GDFFDHBD_03004 [Vibrio sp. B1REV9]